MHREAVVAGEEVAEARKNGIQLAAKVRLAGDVFVQAGDTSFFFCSHCLTCSCRPATRGTELFAPFRLSYFFAEYLVLTLANALLSARQKELGKLVFA